MKNKNKIILSILILLVIFSISVKFKKYVIDKDYFVYMQPACIEGYVCFTNEDAEEPYLKVYRKAYEVEKCMSIGGCQPDFCTQDEVDCSITSCSEDDLEEGESCVTIDEQ